ncbi:hypothetical protein KIN20_035487 [Parelaphostrongylus tenuis]|uniref:Uncharacterized protein n=1 Tax=Parelaphostrongylus tenuis TaxID=148309 RepID=A0AAD5WKV7_PARTN|nr:hypothetical protein KIN20_035487 [Parelaphostrongylus tenuis]
MMTSSVVFSDDEDVSMHAAALEESHTSIMSKPHPSESSEADEKENVLRSVFKNDPVSLRVLADRNRSPGDVFILPMVAPSRLRDEYEFPSDSKDSLGQSSSFVQRKSCSFSKEYSDSPEGTSRRQTKIKSPSSTSSTPRTSHRKRLRLRQLREVGMSIGQPSESDDDEEFTPKRSVLDSESPSGSQAVFTMRLRPRKDLWSCEDDLPLAEFKVHCSMNILNRSDHLSDKNSQERKLYDGDFNRVTSPSSSGCSLLKEESHEVCGLSTSTKGSALSNGISQEVVLTPSAPVKSREKSRRSKRSQSDDEYRGPDDDDDVLLIEIKRRLSTLRSSRRHGSQGRTVFFKY